MDISVPRRWRIVMLILIVGIASFFRVWQLGYPLPQIPPGLFPDEAMNGNNAHEALRTMYNGEGFKIFYPENNGREGLFINIQALSVKLFGHTSFALRIVAALFGILAILAIYFFTREYTNNDWVALLASTLGAVSYWHVSLSRLGFRANMAPFFLTAGLALIYYVYNRSDSARHIRLLIISIAGGVAFGLGFYSYIAYRAAPLLLVPVLALFLRKARTNRDRCTLCLPALYIFFMIVTIVPLALFFIYHPGNFFGRTSQISIFTQASPLTEFIKNTGKTAQMFYFVGDSNWRHNFAGKPELWWPVAIFFTVGLYESARKKYVLLFLWFFAMMLPVAISSEGLPHALRSIIMIPPTLVFAAVGFYTLWQRTHIWLPGAGRIAIALIVLVLIANAYDTYTVYFNRWAGRPETVDAFGGNLYAIGLFLKHAPPDIPKYVITDEVDSIDLTGRPMSLQPILFASQTYLPDGNGTRNIYYIPLRDLGTIECKPDCIIIPVGNPLRILHEAQKKIPSLDWDTTILKEEKLFAARPQPK